MAAEAEAEAERGERVVLVKSNVGTHIAMPISRTTTAADLKRELENGHPIIFPNTGVIKINGLMVKCRSCYYHLPDSIPIKDVFRGLKGTWFLYVDATPPDRPAKPHQSGILASKLRENVNINIDIADSHKPQNHHFKLGMKNEYRESEREEVMCCEVPEQFAMHVTIPRKSKMGNRKKCCRNGTVDKIDEMPIHVKWEERDISSQEGMDIEESETSSQIVGTPSVSACVTGLIAKYFPEFDEVQSIIGSSSPGSYGGLKQKPIKGLNEQNSDVVICNTPRCIAKTPSKELFFPSPVERRCRYSSRKKEVGKRFILAATGIGDSAGGKEKSSITACKSNGGKLFCCGDKTVFEIMASSLKRMLGRETVQCFICQRMVYHGTIKRQDSKVSNVPAVCSTGVSTQDPSPEKATTTCTTKVFQLPSSKKHVKE